MKFGPLGIEQGAWTYVPRQWMWNRNDWPFPWFRHQDPITGRYTRRRIDETNLLSMRQEEPVSEKEALKLPEHGLAGAGFIEARLSRLILGSAN